MPSRSPTKGADATTGEKSSSSQARRARLAAQRRTRCRAVRPAGSSSARSHSSSSDCGEGRAHRHRQKGQQAIPAGMPAATHKLAVLNTAPPRPWRTHTNRAQGVACQRFSAR